MCSAIAIRPPSRLAERLGLAFQLTNIIRDVKEDAGVGRVYLPEEDLDKFGISLSALESVSDPALFRPLLAMEADRAREYYLRWRGTHSAGRRRQPACALGADDHLSAAARKNCAARIRRLHRQKVSLTVREKLGILAKGFLKRLS